MAFNLKMHGERDLIRRLDSIKSSAARRVVRPAVNGALTPLNRAAKRNVPRDTGLLKKSLGKKVTFYARIGSIWGGVGPRAGYRQVVVRKTETGFTRPRMANPQNYAHLVEYGTKRGVTPSRFLTRAFDESRSMMMTTLVTKVRIGLEKLAAKKA